jgi:hypothetical protein
MALAKSLLNLAKKEVDGSEDGGKCCEILRLGVRQVQQRHSLTASLSPRFLTGSRTLIGSYALCLVSVLVLATPATAVAPYQWTTACCAS